MARSKNGCLKILACAGTGSDPSAGSDADADEHTDENKAISDKSRWSFRRRSTRHRVLKNSDISEPETLSSSKAKSDITPNNNAYSSTYSYVSEKPVHQDKQDEKILHQEKLDEKPVHSEKSDEKLAEKPIEKPADKAMEEPADQIVEKSIEHPAEKITDTATEETAEKITETLIQEPAEKATETASEDAAERITENPVKEASEKAVEVLIEEPNESVPVSSTGLKQEETASHVEGSSEPDEDQLESAAVVIQSGIRTSIARQELSNYKDLVKLQAVIRGHLVRRQAAGSLQCLLGIVKMQELVRTHQAQRHAGKFQDTALHSSSEKLLRNGFVLKLMDGMSTSKSTHMKCDPSESDATWKWMERWTSLIPPVTMEHLPEHRENSGLVVEKVKGDAQCDDHVLLDADLSPPNLVLDAVNETLETSDSSAFEAPACILDKSSEVETKCDPEPELIEKNYVDVEHVTDQKTENAVEESLEFSDQQSMQADASREPIPLPEKSEPSHDDISGAYSTEQILGMEAGPIVHQRCILLVPKTGSVSKQNNDAGMAETSVGHDAKVLVAASECGTEISISSTLDSPDRSEGDGGEIVMEIGALENRNYVTDKADISISTVHAEVKDAPKVEAQPHEEIQQNGHVTDPDVTTGPELVQEPHVEPEKSDLCNQLEKPVESYATPEGTPMSRATVSEYHGTPSSEVSVNTKKSRSKKPKSHASKRSLASPSSDSVGRSSTDNFTKDFRHGKRENSSKVTKSEHVDQEPRISNSNPLPSYMQFTESARAKASANASPKMSPDIQDNHPRKRHSLPMTNGKQDSSPRMQRSSSQAQQNVKSNGTVPHSSSDKRWHI
ncbi:hypothetical protein QOZ80_4AG0300600 [Eleusine coracana subsp. coracana]|nr:hypothetical protein QOZ80_4AG0300600 [Eleusine coracana subsp. coracana]